MLDQALRQLYLQESASKAAAAAAESSDAAVFLAVRTAGDSAGDSCMANRLPLAC